MDKQRKWHLFLILAVIGLTLYNILPTLFYYSKPLKTPIGQEAGKEIALSIEKRLIKLEEDASEWIASFCKLLDVHPAAISIEETNPQLIKVRFVKTSDAEKFRKFLPRAGSLIPFAPAALSLAPQEEEGSEVLVQRQIPFRLDFSSGDLTLASKKEENGDFSPFYKKLVLDRVSQLGAVLTGATEPAQLLKYIESHGPQKEYLEALAGHINTLSDAFKEKKSGFERFAASFTQGSFKNRGDTVQSLISAFEGMRDEIKKEKASLKEEESLRLLEEKESQIAKAENFLKKQKSFFAAGQNPLTLGQILQDLDLNAKETVQTLSLESRNPFFSQIEIDWSKEQISLKMHPEISRLKGKDNRLEQLLINEIAKITNLTNETVRSTDEGYEIPLHSLSNSSGFLVLNLEKIAAKQTSLFSSVLKKNWTPKHPDLQNLPVVSLSDYESLSPDQKALCLIVSAPLAETTASKSFLRNSSLYVIAKGFDQILKNYEAFPGSEQAALFSEDFKNLLQILRQNGFAAYPGTLFPEEGKETDFIFEKGDIFLPLIAATREQFNIYGTQKYAVLELSDVEQRILTENKIDTQIHEDLLKWNDEYNAAKVSLNPATRYDVPKPTKSVFLSNAALSFKKLFRGDERKIIRWGLDLSGGKTVQIELRDANHQVVTNEADIKQGINELYNRVNKMGVSEVSIRQLGNQIVLDFPGSQSLSASELIKASSMYFHIVNEKFSLGSPLAPSVNRFLQDVWNEAVVTNRKDPQSINKIAWKHLYGEGGSAHPQPRSDAAKTLLENGLKLQSTEDFSMGNEPDLSISKIAVYRGSDFSEWHGQSHPLLVTFKNYALEGSQLENIHSNYDPSKGNYLSFDVQGSSIHPSGKKQNPRQDLYAWTSLFSKDKVLGTSYEAYSKGRGWRMAVVLNDTVINAPVLESAIQGSAMISGSFSQREVTQLAADLKAGSLTFTPHILSEKNVSPELGQTDRLQGIVATAVALLLVIAAMLVYYRFAGLVASVAVFFNLLILWATLQNMGATLSLAGIAGIILTVGMAVDANVLVFERIKEEFALSGKIASAIQAGYQKAYSAIIDSNVTTIIAALILLNFDAGPIKGFAVTLIIGIVSSMFTALFMTRYYFTGWVQNPKHKALQMAHWIKAKKIDFLKKSKFAFTAAFLIITLGGALVYTERSSIFGMDFTGGFSLHVEIKPDGSQNYLEKVEQALQKTGKASSRDFQIRELNPSNQLRILFGTSMEQPGKPFYQMPLELEGQTRYSYEKNPRIRWVVDSLKSSGLSLTDSSLSQLDKNWTSMSGQMSESMRNNALIGLLISFVCIFIYIAFRFEYKFASAAILCLIHDVLITLGMMGILHLFGVPVQIDLNTVAAIMTIVGYSLNDTIIVFDRIREEMHLHRNWRLPQIVNSALNATLSRTTMTSGTTLLVLIALVVLGGASIFSFALVMTIGVFFGTLSSWYIASPLMLFFHKREEKKEKRLTAT